MSSTPCTESHCRHGLSVQVPGFLISELSVSFGVGEAFYCSRSPCQHNGCRSLALHPQSDRLVSFTPCAESRCRHGLPVQVPGFLIQSFPSPRGVGEANPAALGRHVSIMDALRRPFTLRAIDLSVFHSLCREPLQAWIHLVNELGYYWRKSLCDDLT